MIKNNFAVFILSHGRCDNIKTIKTLEKSGYTGDTYIIVDNLDKTKEHYKEKYGGFCIIFDKHEAHNITDCIDNTGDMRAVVFARNYCWKIAKDLGIDYFLVLDDDYSTFAFRQNDKGQYLHKTMRSTFDDMCNTMVDFLKVNENIYSLALSQGGDFIGGKENRYAKISMLTRKCMNSFFCATARPFRFLGRINEDANAYVLEGSRGKLFFTYTCLDLTQTETQSNEGGLTDIYLALGTYVKSFYSVICHPSSVTVKEMGTTHRRLHHSIKWAHTVPKILSEKWKKKR